MEEALDRYVRRRARDRCEYCLLPESASRLRHVVDHVVARQHGGGSTDDNLALCCGRCNLHEGPTIAGLDPQTGLLTRLFHPRHDVWDEHFALSGAEVAGRTAVGRTTAYVLAMNQPGRVAARQALIDAGEFPPAD
jgi:hypothetical protein